MDWPHDFLIKGAKPYFQEESGIIYHADCRDILPHLPKVDLVLTDFPYANNTDYGDVYEDTIGNLVELITFCFPFNAKRSLVTCGVANLHYYPKPDWILCWTVSAGVGSCKWGFSCWQPILCYGKDPYLEKSLGRRPDLFQEMFYRDIPRDYHPCSKPKKIWQALILRASLSVGDVILDPFLGSGTTAVAAKELGRKYIGIDINMDYCKLAARRLGAWIEEPKETRKGLFF